MTIMKKKPSHFPSEKLRQCWNLFCIERKFPSTKTLVRDVTKRIMNTLPMYMLQLEDIRQEPSFNIRIQTRKVLQGNLELFEYVLSVLYDEYPSISPCAKTKQEINFLISKCIKLKRKIPIVQRGLPRITMIDFTPVVYIGDGLITDRLYTIRNVLTSAQIIQS